MIQALIATSTANPKRLFLLDGLGALLSAFLLGGVLTQLESVFGMPKQALYFLAFLPCLFAAYDFHIFFSQTKKWGKHLKIIAFANLMYCLISIGFMVHHMPQLTTLGWLYFILELLIVLGLVVIEFKTSAALEKDV